MGSGEQDAKYRELRAKGSWLLAGLSALCADRLLLVACAILEKRELFDKEFKKPLEATAA